MSAFQGTIFHTYLEVWKVATIYDNTNLIGYWNLQNKGYFIQT